MSAVYKKELRFYFSTMSGYISIAMILLMTGIFVTVLCFRSLYPNMELALPTASIILLLAVPIMAMHTFSEERRQKTDQLLYTLPITTGQIVAGKYLAMMTVLAVPVLVIGLYPLILMMYAGKGFGATLIGTYGALLLFYLEIGAMAAICMFMSSLTESQIVAAVLGSGVLIFCYFAQLLAGTLPTTALASFIAFTVLILLAALVVYLFVRNYWAAFFAAVVMEGVMLIFYLRDSTPFAGLFQKAIGAVSLFDPFNNAVSDYVFDLTAAVYYLSAAVLFFFLTAQTVEKRRWS